MAKKRKLLTQLGVENLKGGGKRLEIADAGMPGLYLIVQPKPTEAKSWAVRYRYGTRTRKHTLGPFPLLDVAKARKRAQDALEAIERGEDPGAEKIAARKRQHDPAADRDAFSVCIRRFFHRHAIPSTRSWRETARLLGLQQVDEEQAKPGQPVVFRDVPGRIAARWADRLVTSIRRRDIIDLLDESKDRGATTTANRELAAMRKFFAWCVEREIIENNPALGIAKPAPERRRERVLSDDELRLVWKASAALGYPYGTLIKLLIMTAQRRSELAGASWPEFGHNSKIWTIPGARTKNAREQTVPLSELACAILAEIPRFAAGKFLFGLKGRGRFSGFSKAKAALDAKMVEIASEEARKPVEIASWTVHDLRRTAATRMGDIGVMPHVIEAILNHVSGSKSGVAGTYNRALYEAEKREALERWAQYVVELADADLSVEPASGKASSA